MNAHWSQIDQPDLKQTKPNDESGIPLTVTVFLALAIAILSVMGQLVFE